MLDLQAYTMSFLELERTASQVRRDIVRMVHAVQSGHPGGSLGCTEFLVALYFDLMAHSPQEFDMDGTNQDLFFLSNGHISPVFYSVLSRVGYFNTAELKTFRKLNSRLQGHPTTHEGLRWFNEWCSLSWKNCRQVFGLFLLKGWGKFLKSFLHRTIIETRM